MRRRTRTGVAPICRALAIHGVQIAPRTDWAHRVTTEPDPAATRAPDLVGRRWRVSAPNLLEVADFAHVPMTLGFGYTAFVVDAYAGVIAGWECSLTKDAAFVERALHHAAAFRNRQGRPFDGAIHHSDAGSQYKAIHFSETLMLAGLRPSIGTVGDALDNALCETTIGLALGLTEASRVGLPPHMTSLLCTSYTYAMGDAAHV